MKQLLKDQHGIAAILVVLIVLGVIVVGVVAAGAVILSNDMAITVNNRPRKCLGFRTPIEVAASAVALRH